MDKSASQECIGKFLRVRIRLNLQKPLMPGMMAMFLDEGRVWVQFKYEGSPNYCFYCRKLGHVTRVCKVHVLRGMHGMAVGDESLKQGGPLSYEGMEACINMRGNVLRSLSRRTKSQSTGEGNGRTMESERGR